MSAPDVPQPPSIDLLSPFIARMGDIANQGAALIDQLHRRLDDLSTAPFSTIVRLHFVAESTFRSAILCLATPETSLASYALIRTSLEAWSHLEFIADDDEGGTAACRALRYERGALNEWDDVVAKAPDEIRPEWAASHDDRVKGIDGLWNELECRGHARRRGDVTRTLKKIDGRPNQQWVLRVWSASSASTHAYGADFILRKRNGVSEVVWALPSQRASWIIWATASFGHLTTRAARSLDAGRELLAPFEATWRSLCDDASLHRIAGHEFDQ